MVDNDMSVGGGAMTEPAGYRSRVLLCVCGLTPQIITETLYWLACVRKPAFVPTRVVVMTTTTGAERVRLQLRSDNPGWLARLSGDYGLAPIPLAAGDVHVIEDAAGRPLDDLRTADDNTAAADRIVAAVAELTRDPDCALHVSMAGGRKTLGFFAGYALSLYGRDQDRLSHVLVSSQFETHPDFFYPTPYSRVIMTRDNTPLDCREAEVSVADLPFVRMRDGLSDALRTGRTSYALAVAAAQHRFAPPSLVIDLRARTIAAGNQPVTITPALLAFYTWLARKAVAGQPWISMDELTTRETARRHGQDYLRDYGRFVSVVDAESTSALKRDGMDYDAFKVRVTRINKYLMANLQDAGPDRYRIARSGRRMAYSWGLALPPDAIRIIE